VNAREAVNELVIANRILAHLGVVDSFGHITVRNPEHPDRYFMSRSRAPGQVTHEDILEFRLDSSPIDLQGRQPYSERPIHGMIYESRPDITSVCHNHARDLLPFAVTGTAMRPAIHTAGVMGAEVPVWDIRDEFGDTSMLVTTNQMGRSLAHRLGAGRAALLRGHGSVVAAASVREAVFIAHYMRVNAEVLLKTGSLGAPITFLSVGEIELSSKANLSPGALDRAWDEWAAVVGFTEEHST
jgi:ribulose-5-phosphate 4-epimerase/fuculose-1-phosphate aldolase